MRRSTYVEFNKIRFSLLWFFGDLLWFFKDLVKIKNKRKIEKPLPPHPQTAHGDYVNGFVSLRRLDGWFCGLGRKNKFGSKLRKAKKNFFSFYELALLVAHHSIKEGPRSQPSSCASTQSACVVVARLLLRAWLIIEQVLGLYLRNKS